MARSVVRARVVAVYAIAGGTVLHNNSIVTEMYCHQQLGLKGSGRQIQFLGYATTGDATTSQKLTKATS